MMTGPAAWAVIPAAGSGSRLGADRPKQYLDLLGHSVLWHTVQQFQSDSRFAGVMLALAADDAHFPQSDVATTPVLTCVGGATRQASVFAALQALAGKAQADDWIFVHDAARPLLLRSDLDQLFAVLAQENVGALLGAPVADTLKRRDPHGRVTGTVDRDGLWRALTPQVFRYRILHAALQQAEQAGVVHTDDTAAVEQLGLFATMLRGRDDNLKITQGQDLAMAEQILREQREQGLR
ncbi:2-C-methyl-D-erythritol 4-phosphate cytidylyltransferase [Permianibacter sp. IMCC34836]|nr:2-C-methyl-D-erythritol 4-phosphate cytidylyltransferase [Permianibacter fluminis]